MCKNQKLSCPQMCFLGLSCKFSLNIFCKPVKSNNKSFVKGGKGTAELEKKQSYVKVGNSSKQKHILLLASKRKILTIQNFKK